MKTYDCFTFFNELDLLKMRLNILNDYVDFFVLVESNKTHSGKSKDLVFERNKNQFSDFSHKIIHIIVDDMPELKDTNRWVLENFQRNAIMRGLTKCDASDLILISDLDEIPNPAKIKEVKKILIKKSAQNGLIYQTYQHFKRLVYKLSQNSTIKKYLEYFTPKSAKTVSFKQNLYYYYINGFINTDWLGSKAVLYKDLISCFHSSPQEIREVRPKNSIPAGGWHFSYLLTPEQISEKIKSFAHSEFDKKEFTGIEAIKNNIANGKDLFGRNENITYVKIDSSYPKWILDNVDNYQRYISKNI